MPKKAPSSIFVCQDCGHSETKWFGRCPKCQSWNVEEETNTQALQPTKSQEKIRSGIAVNSHKLADIKEDFCTRTDTGMKELNRVLGGGLTIGSVVLLGGDPGIGKSTLLLQICNTLSISNSVLYISGEESLSQIKSRAIRMGINSDNLSLLTETNINNIMACIDKERPDILIVDSIQTISDPTSTSPTGSVSQIRDITNSLVDYAKTNNVSVFIVGHVTKDGAIAGPKTLEHMVDTVLYFEGEKLESYRILRAVKNRFGSTNEIGIFEMKETGFSEVDNPSLLFLTEGNKSGSCLSCILEGTRPLLSEIQALVCPTSFGNPRRMASGVDLNRFILMSAVLEKNGLFGLSKSDIYINVVGGIKIEERSCDLPVILSIASSIKDIPLPEKTVAIGEVSLSGDIRMVPNLEKRISECVRLGFTNIIVPTQTPSSIKTKANLIKVKNIKELLYKLNFLGKSN